MVDGYCQPVHSGLHHLVVTQLPEKQYTRQQDSLVKIHPDKFAREFLPLAPFFTRLEASRCRWWRGRLYLLLCC
jgi:hypothetical protein